VLATLQPDLRSLMRSVRRLAPAALGFTLLLAACQPSNQAGASSPQQVADAFVSDVVLPNYQQLVEDSEHLSAALNALATTPGVEQLDAARKAWQQVRKTWETGESWAFGPAESGGFDGNLDDWPVNEKDLRTALASGALTPELFAKLTTTAKGFHGIEAVLYGTQGIRPEVNQLSAAQLTYLRQAGGDLASNAKGLAAAWDGPKGFGSAFKAEPQAAVAEILQGMVGTLQEVAAEKLGASLASRNKSDLESFYSDNTRADIVANLAGVSEALQRSGLIQLIASRDAQLARSLQGAMDEAQTSARALPEQLNTAINDPAGRSKIEAVMANSERTVALLKQAAARLS
jgi:predicted lipoprotein